MDRRLMGTREPNHHKRAVRLHHNTRSVIESKKIGSVVGIVFGIFEDGGNLQRGGLLCN